MDTISKLTPSISLSDVGDAVSNLPFDRVIDVFDDVTPDFGDISDAALSAARTGRRLGTRTVRTTYRVVQRNPRTALGIVAGLIAATALVMFLRKRREEQPEVKLRSAA